MSLARFLLRTDCQVQRNSIEQFSVHEVNLADAGLGAGKALIFALEPVQERIVFVAHRKTVDRTLKRG